ncbi:MAG: FHA domain-containing protein [Bacteroidales bacterium]|nr:FHA domain-containing protein [Bacteroidales bacterium]
MQIITIGRDPGNNVVINDPGVSRNHCQLIIHDDGSVSVIDTGSSNGTTVNGQPVCGEITLNPGDVLLVGGVPFDWETYMSVNHRHHHSKKKSDVSNGGGSGIGTGGILGIVFGGIALIGIVIGIVIAVNNTDSGRAHHKKKDKGKDSVELMETRDENGSELSESEGGKSIRVFDNGSKDINKSKGANNIKNESTSNNNSIGSSNEDDLFLKYYEECCRQIAADGDHRCKACKESERLYEGFKNRHGEKRTREILLEIANKY